MAWENDPRHFAKAEPVPGPAVEAMQAVARETGMVVVYPMFERDGDRYYNTAIVLDTEGRIAGKYRKTSVPSARLLPGGVETFYFSPGDLPLTVFDTPFGFRFGIIICYERNLSEPARCVALEGADLLVCPVATVDVVRPWWEVLLRAHAIQNVMYVGACNKVGEDEGGAPGVRYFGTSLFIDPRGEVQRRGSENEEDVVVGELDLEDLRAQRERWCFLRDRRPELYGAITRRGAPGAAVRLG